MAWAALMTADSISGAISSPTLAEADASRLPRASATAPSVESYDSLTPTGRVPASSPLRVRFSAAGAPGTPDTDEMSSPLGSAPDSDQPAPVRPSARTGSSNSTRIVVSDVALATVMLGAWPSSRCCCRGMVPSAMPRWSAMAAASIVTEPVASGGAPPGENVITCTAAPPPDTVDTIRGTPSTVRGP